MLMASYLKTEADLIENELDMRLRPDELRTVKGDKVILSLAAKTNSIFILHFFLEDCPWFASPKIDELLGYAPGQGPSRNPALLGKILRLSNCLGEFDKYNLHFGLADSLDYRGALNLRCISGDYQAFVFTSQVLQSFSASGKVILTVMAPAVEAIALHTNGSSPGLNDIEKNLQLLQSLPQPLQLTMRCIWQSLPDKAIEDRIFKKRSAISGYVRKLKNKFGVETRTDLAKIYGLLTHLS